VYGIVWNVNGKYLKCNFLCFKVQKLHFKIDFILKKWYNNKCGGQILWMRKKIGI